MEEKMLNILHLMSTPDNHCVSVVKNDGNINKLDINIQGNNTLNLLVNSSFARLRAVTFGAVEKQEIVLPKADIIINSICDPDTNMKGLEEAISSVKDVRLPMINHPTHILKTTRDKTYELLHTIDGLNVPKTVRIFPRCLADIPKLLEKEKMTYPYIFRTAGDHGGEGMELIKSESELYKLEAFAFDGRAFYVIEFVDFKSKDNYYRKARIMVVNGEAFVRHMIISDSWKIHAESRVVLMNDDIALREEEKNLVENPPTYIKEICKAIYDILELDFFGMDCNLDDVNGMLIFEINTCMNTSFRASDKESMEKYKYLVQSSTVIKEKFKALLYDKVNLS
jgi:glutathione synthase/RimK-type ligase-like ATP-grasp enzyme